MSDEDARRDELLRSMVGGATPDSGRVRLVEYDPTWPSLFEREEARIRATLGPVALRIEHVGSTSVPGLAAKSIIDMVLVVNDSADESAYVQALERRGYVLRIREPDWYQHRLLEGPDTPIHVHVFSDGCPEIERMLMFRDRLRRHPDERERYEATKRALAAREWAFLQDYADAKSEIVEEILTRANADDHP